MKFKKTILAISLMQFIAGILCSPVFAVYPGTFDYSNEKVFMLDISKRGDRNILYIDFKDKTKKILKSGARLGYPSINRKMDVLTFINSLSIYLYDIKKEKIFFTIPITSGEKITWDYSGNKISYYDSSSHSIMEIDINSREIIKIPFSGIMFQTKWDKKINGFLYQLLDEYPVDGVGHLGAKIMRVVDGKLEEYKGVRTLTLSPDGKYYYEGVSYPEEGNIVSFYKVDGDKLIASYKSVSPLYNADVIWGVDIVRVLFEGGIFDFKKGKFVTYTDSFWPQEGPVPERFNPRRDMAADWNNYVLMWNEETKIFEVEDINTGKIIKTYKKFW